MLTDDPMLSRLMFMREGVLCPVVLTKTVQGPLAPRDDQKAGTTCRDAHHLAEMMKAVSARTDWNR